VINISRTEQKLLFLKLLLIQEVDIFAELFQYYVIESRRELIGFQSWSLANL